MSQIVKAKIDAYLVSMHDLEKEIQVKAHNLSGPRRVTYVQWRLKRG